MQLKLRFNGPIEIVINNRLHFSVAEMSDALVEQIKDLFTHRNPNKEDSEGPAFYRTWKQDNGILSLPRGGMSRLRNFLVQAEIDYEVSDERVEGDRQYLDNDWGGRPIPVHAVTLRKWQEAAVEALIAKQNCILRAPTASGKTTAGLSLFARMNLSTIIVVPTRGLIDQWVERLAKEMGLNPKDVGVIGGGKHRTAPITVATQGALAVGIRPEWKKAFGALIYDEVQKSAAPTCFAAIDPWPAKFRLGMSADESRHDHKEFLAYDLFGDVAADIKREDILEAKQIVEVDMRLIPTEFEAPWYKAAVMSGNKFRIRASFHKLMQELCDDEDRNKLISGVVRHDVKRGNQMMILSNRREHCMVLDQVFVKQGLKSGIMLGGADSRGQFNVTKDGIRDGSVRVVVGTLAAIGTGQDFPSLTAGFIVMPIHNNRQLLEQAKGRFARVCEEIGKSKATLYYAWDKDVYGRRPLENFLKWHKRVFVLDGKKWVSGFEYLERMGGIMKGKVDFTKIGQSAREQLAGED